MDNRHLFASHLLNEQGIEKAKKIGELFLKLTDDLDTVMTDGRLKSIVHTKLEEAAFFAKKSMAVNLDNQLITDSEGNVYKKCEDC